MQTRNINNEGEKTRGLIIAVSDYHDKQLGKLDFCQKDGEEMYQLLKSLGYEIADNHKLVGVVSYDELKKSIKEFFIDKNIKSTDTLLFYFSGHGIAEDNGEHFLAASVRTF